MTKELVVSSTRHETKVAVLEDDQLVEVYFQRANEYSLAGSIHKGRVTRVLPGMQSAFVDLGLDRDTFLYVSDFFEENEEYDRIAIPAEERPARAEKSEPAALSAAAAASAERPPAAPAEEGDFRDRRGRRSRRRRSRGRGLPESKYASETAGPSRPPERVVPEAPPEEENRDEFPVLPGESLAKHRRSELIESAGGDQADEAPETAEAPLEEPVVESAAHYDAADPPEPEPPVEATGEEAAAEPVDIAYAEPEAAPAESAGEESEGEEPALVFGAGEEDAAPEGEAEQLAQPESSPEAGEDVEPARIPQSLTAALREHGSRYLHRAPRNLRRKMRRGPPPEGWTEGQRHGEAPRDTTPDAKTVSRPEKPGPASIAELLKEGQEILVQIAKEPLGQKGARITSHIALPGRYVVYMPTVEHLGVSRKIASEEERARLKRILLSVRSGMTGGFIVRTAGEGKSEEDIAADVNFIYSLWLDIRQRAEKRSAPALLHHDLEIVQRVLRDQLNESFKSIWVDNEDVYESVLRFVERFQPGLVNRVKLYTRPAPIFDAFNITSELEKALRPKVWLKSGGYIVINQTEALVAIDVNTGKYIGKSNRLEDTIVKTNTEAVKEIVRQMRLRDLGGIIVVDFIDMDERKNRQKVMQTLEEAMRADRAPYKVLQFNDFGLVAITRKRVKQSLERTLCAPCPHCEGAGYIKSVPTVIGEIIQEAHKMARAVEGKDVILRVHPDVAKTLKSTENKYLEEIEEILGRPVLVTGDPLLHQEKFDLA